MYLASQLQRRRERRREGERGGEREREGGRERGRGRERRGNLLLYVFIFMLKFIKHRDTALFRLYLNWCVIHYEWHKGSVML